MNQINFQPYAVVEAKRYQEDIIEKAQQYKLMAELKNDARQKSQRESRILALIGKEMKNLGARLESRYGNCAEVQATLTRQSSPDGCA